MAVAAPPYVSYSSMTEARIPAGMWATVYSSLQALKGHVQEYPGCQSFDVFVRAEGDGDVLVHCYTTWDSAGQLGGSLGRGYTFEGLLGDIGWGLGPGRSLVLERVF